MNDKKTRKLRLTFHGRVIDHLGIQMYQSPVAAIAELVANSWDADAENVWITLPSHSGEGAEFEIKDDGSGMTFDDCQGHYLNVGWARREESGDRSSGKSRPVLGRKGIGKFAGFGIAETVRVDTTSKRTGEKTVFELNLKNLRKQQYISRDGEIPVLEYAPPRQPGVSHGTVITLKNLDISRRPSQSQFAKSMARRFLLHQGVADFRVFVNNKPLPKAEESGHAEFIFPRDYSADEIPPGLTVEDGWGKEKLSNGNVVRWRFVFYEDPIEEDELRGIAIFARGKLAQTPFFFNLTGGLGGQHGLEYLSGGVQADYLDGLDIDIIATDRQSINWEQKASIPLEEWGQQRVKELLRLWRERRGAARAKELEQKIAGFGERLDRLGTSESKTVKRALQKLAQVASLSKTQFEELGGAVLNAWDQGRLLELISTISESQKLSESELLNILLESEVLTALSTAEAVKAKILLVGGLKLRIRKHELETAVRDYIENHPWLVSPQWETFKKEVSVGKLAKEVAKSVGMVGEPWKGRVDLVLSSGTQLLLLEFMRPGLTLDWDHISRCERYVITLRSKIEANTAGQFRSITGYIVADKLDQDPTVLSKIKEMKSNDILASDWPTLFEQALAKWREFLGILASRAPEDERLQVLLE